MVSRLVTDPEGFIDHQADFGGGTKPFYAVFAGGVGLAIYAAASAVALGSEFTAIQTAILAAIGANLLRPFILWVALAVAFYLVSIAFGGNGSIADVFRISGWGFLPFLPMGIVWAVGRYLALRDESLPPDVQSNYLGYVIPALNNFNAKAASEPVYLVALVIGFLFLLFSGYLWMLGVQESRNLDRTQAAITVAIPGLIWVAYFLQRTM